MFSVEPLPAATDAGLTETVGPAGETVAVRLTVPGLPTCVVLIALVPVVPVCSEMLLGFAEMVKSAGGGAVTVSVTVVECTKVPSVPVTVMVKVPVVEPAVMFNVEPLHAATEVGLTE